MAVAAGSGTVAVAAGPDLLTISRTKTGFRPNAHLCRRRARHQVRCRSLTNRSSRLRRQRGNNRPTLTYHHVRVLSAYFDGLSPHVSAIGQRRCQRMRRGQSEIRSQPVLVVRHLRQWRLDTNDVCARNGVQLCEESVHGWTRSVLTVARHNVLCEGCNYSIPPFKLGPRLATTAGNVNEPCTVLPRCADFYKTLRGRIITKMFDVKSNMQMLTR
jgi:hypothetical protein